MVELSNNDIANVDSIFRSRYNIDLYGRNIAWFEQLEDVAEHYKYYNRQYLGYTNGTEEIKVLISLLNFKDRRRAKEKFSSWEKEIVVGFGEFYELNTKRFEVNLAEGSLRIF